MKRTILIYGLIAGLIVSVFMLVTMPLFVNGTLNYEKGEVMGYTSMVIAFSMIFFGIKACRDQHLGGTMRFWKAFQIGILICTIGSVMYALSWEVSYNNMDEGYIQRMVDKRFEKMEAQGKPAAEIAEAREKFAAFAEYYKIFPIRFAITLMEIFPVGLLISLISALLLRKTTASVTPSTQS